MNKSLFKSVIVKNNDTQANLAHFLGISLSTLSSKINGSSSFRQNEISAIKARYNLTPGEVDSIFFAS